MFLPAKVIASVFLCFCANRAAVKGARMVPCREDYHPSALLGRIAPVERYLASLEPWVPDVSRCVSCPMAEPYDHWWSLETSKCASEKGNGRNREQREVHSGLPLSPLMTGFVPDPPRASGSHAVPARAPISLFERLLRSQNGY